MMLRFFFVIHIIGIYEAWNDDDADAIVIG